MPAARRVLRQAATACDRVKHSVEGYGGVFGENVWFSVYTEISEPRGISDRRNCVAGEIEQFASYLSWHFFSIFSFFFYRFCIFEASCFAHSLSALNSHCIMLFSFLPA